MYRVEKNGAFFTVRDKNQLSAFLNNGWKETSAEKVEVSKPTSKEDEKVPSEKEEEKSYSKKDITFMKKEDLQVLGDKLGIENALESNSKELKTLIIEKLGL